MTDWSRMLARRSFLELDARARAEALLDDGTARVLCGPFERLESPWLEPQAVTPQADDGVTIVKGEIGGRRTVVASIEQRFQGGGVGEVSGAKISEALRLAAADSRAGAPTAAVLLIESGGVRLQEANLGLNAVAEICAAVLELRPHAPVVGVVAGTVGSFGGISIATGLCTRVIVTPEGRIGLNGPAVVEQEAGVEEFDASDRALIWAIDGGAQRHATGLADTLVEDDADALRDAVADAVAGGSATAGSHRSERLDVLASRLSLLDPSDPPAPEALRDLWGQAYEPTRTGEARPPRHASPSGRGATWLRALGGAKPVVVIPSVLRADTETATYLAVVPDADNPFPRARDGEVGLTECLALAEVVHEIIAGPDRRGIVAVVDLPSQAYGRIEEMAGLHQAIAATVDAYAAARAAGHPMVALIVGTALSGGFLAHGLQASQLLALDDPGVEIHAMHKSAAAKITLRSVAELEELAKRVLPLSYDVRDWAKLGFCDGLIAVDDADAPSTADVERVRREVDGALERASADLSRMDSEARAASRTVRETLGRQWRDASGS